MFRRKLAVLIGCLSFGVNAAGYDLVTLGSKGGIQDGNLTAFMLKSEQDDNYVMLDAGSIVNGLIVSEQKGAFSDIEVPEASPYTKVGYLLKERIKGYFISHAHLDHVAGMIISSPDDSNKPIYALSATNDDLQTNYFNWSAWPNFGNEGKGFKLSKYTYTDLPAAQWQAVTGTSLNVKAMPLSHSGGQSTAFLMKDTDGDVFAYFGDTGPDAVEKSDALNNVWSSLSEHVKNDKLKGIVIEVSFSNETPDKQLFGHLTPTWLLEELKTLEAKSGKGSLEGLDVVISHIKYSLKKGESPESIIKRQLEEANTLGVNFHFPQQGDTLSFAD
ncbi:3',5'-cyclic-nucleotide phosphodiesterase [Enterovibrio sp. ZSDZ35]|uniref:3',5'-cyclic-nucleotide phosphodiesterase n=1 Tax=Enterovibrio qingdaonensis TaxID=2899818 RepID=A0ABT5QH32_9GAMM|nr:3',5'-cyclic-nucleotide phosphodiesterase [Enterovibrio sp. ZSDZ35]MDD1780276.1 3',5'-cyclic-nucleotide phosphodiesterase [Enterovibrio sp. ZSDZ35]